MIELKDLTAEEVIAFHKQGRYVSGFQGYVEVNVSELEKDVPEDAGFVKAKGHKVKMKNHVKNYIISKDNKKALLFLGAKSCNGIYQPEMSAQELSAFINQFGAQNIKTEIDKQSYSYGVMSRGEKE
jgi:hypothetical protein